MLAAFCKTRDPRLGYVNGEGNLNSNGFPKLGPALRNTGFKVTRYRAIWTTSQVHPRSNTLPASVIRSQFEIKVLDFIRGANSLPLLFLASVIRHFRSGVPWNLNCSRIVIVRRIIPSSVHFEYSCFVVLPLYRAGYSLRIFLFICLRSLKFYNHPLSRTIDSSFEGIRIEWKTIWSEPLNLTSISISFRFISISIRS